MQTQSVQALIRPAPQNANHDFVARMSSRDIADLVGSRHDKVKQSIERLVERGVIAKPPMGDGPKSANGVVIREYLVCKRDSFVVVAQLSPEFTAALVDRWQQLEAEVAKPMPADLSKLEILQMALESEKARVLLTVQVEAQAKKIDHLENLFKEGMSHVQFCKGLNGVNVMQVGHFLEGRNWLYNESKSGTRYRVAAYARDKYMTEHQQEITPHGKEAFISYTPILLRKGAVRLYELYLAGDLPMKKNWDGLHTHDKAVRGAA
ncbi:Rha family transcriptional regulator [Pseudomonas sp. p99-361]|uniref:Rha family transcriptional regulator n=1 Tax=Pseudomonas sp. p99-361 TaxID=2479852 RepID=UPI000F77816E|nr:Rha family transcriptional regulator [Pseudomonas sp. p99-361]RRV60346.1 transporter [Pseudomonas sp. p99-361]